MLYIFFSIVWITSLNKFFDYTVSYVPKLSLFHLGLDIPECTQTFSGPIEVPLIFISLRPSCIFYSFNVPMGQLISLACIVESFLSNTVIFLPMQLRPTDYFILLKFTPFCLYSHLIVLLSVPFFKLWSGLLSWAWSRLFPWIDSGFQTFRWLVCLLNRLSIHSQTYFSCVRVQSPYRNSNHHDTLLYQKNKNNIRLILLPQVCCVLNVNLPQLLFG